MKILKIGHLYPKLLNIYGDIGNIITLQKRAEWRGIKVLINEINIGDSIDKHDIYFIGGKDARPYEKLYFYVIKKYFNF